MAFEAFIPKAIALDGDDIILEGNSYRRPLVVKKLVGTVETPVNMTEYDAVAPQVVFKDKSTEEGGVTTGCPSGVCAWTDASAGELRLDLTQTQTNSGTGASSAQKFDGVVEITVRHDTEEDSAGVKKLTTIFKGTWKIQKTAVAS